MEQVTYVNEENGWSVVRLAVPERRHLVKAVGHLPGVRTGENLRLVGRWTLDRRWGEQFLVESFITVHPATLVGMEKYLGSGLIHGIGAVMASRLVRHFGLETLDVIEREPERLTEVEGVGPKRRAQIETAWAAQRAVREVMLFLQSHGISTAYAVKIFRHYGDRAIALVKENPFRLATDIFGIGFKTADRIASTFGISPTSPQRAEAGVLFVLKEFSDEGHVYAPHQILMERAAAVLKIECAIIERALADLERQGLVRMEPLSEGRPVYLRSFHVSESGAAELLRAVLAAEASPITIDVTRAIDWFERRQGMHLVEPQREAIRQAITSKVLVITGGPGTGKTTIVNAIVCIMEQKGRRIMLCAPTGRAAKRMNETTRREAKTIHRLLEFSPKRQRFERNADRLLEADVVIVDEMSMVDIVLFYNLLQAVPPPCQIVLVGDRDQLPSVGPGSVLGDLIRSGVGRVVALTEIFRQARESLIVVNAHRINQGRMPLPGAEESADFFFLERTEPQEVLETVKELVSRRIPERFGADPFEDIQVLTPMLKGLLGAASLNSELQELLNPEGESVVRGGRRYRTGDKVMQIRNNYDLDVFNGDLGRVAAVDADAQQVQVLFEGRGVTYDWDDLDQLVLGYACSIHKSQGSEYPVVVILLHTQHYALLQRNLLYTGITRGKRLVILVGRKKAVAIAVKNDRVQARYSGLVERLAAVAGPS